MSRAIESLEVLYNNPFIFAPLLRNFYQGLGQKENGILLSYLVLPVALYAPTRTYLEKARSTSSLQVLVRDRQRVFGLPERIANYRRLTNLSLQQAISSQGLVLDEDLVVKLGARSMATEDAPPGTAKASLNFGRLLSPLDVPSTFRLLGLKNL